MHLGPVEAGRHRRAHRAGPAAHVQDHRRPRDLAPQRDRLLDEERGTRPGHEHPGRHGHPQAAELRPAQDVFERLTADAARDHGGQGVGGGSGGDEQRGLVLGEHAPGGPEPQDDLSGSGR